MITTTLQNSDVISIVIPVFNEAGTVRQLYDELCAVADQHGLSVELIIVDDGSTDGSWELIDEIAGQDERVLGIRFRRNFGKAAALRVGFERAVGDILVMMDGDLQDDPAELPRMLEKLDQDLDVVSGWKKQRHDPWHKRYPSKGFNLLVNGLSGLQLHDHNCGFKCIRREVMREFELYGERHRFIPVLAAAQGFRVGEITVQHRPRTSGVSKYGWSRIPKGLMDIVTISLVTSCQNRPQHWLGSIGLCWLAVAAVCIIWLTGLSLVAWLTGGSPVVVTETATFFVGLTSIVVGIQFLAVGLVAELVVATQTRRRATCSISNTTEQPVRLQYKQAA